MEPKRLYRSSIDRKVAGVAGGLAEYFDIDPLLFRLIFVILAISGGAGLFIYIVLWIVTPERPGHVLYTKTAENTQPKTEEPPKPEEEPENQEHREQPEQNSGTYEYKSTFHESSPGFSPGPQQPVRKQKGSLTWGLILISLGALLMAAELIPQINFWDLWPVVLIIAGIGLLAKAVFNKNHNTNQF